MDEDRRVFQRLHEIGFERVLEQRRHRSVRTQFARRDQGAVIALADDDIAQAALKIAQIAGQAQNGHDFGGDGDVKSRFARRAVGRTAQPGNHLAQRAVIDVQHSPQRDPAGIDIQRISPVDMIVQHCSEQVVRSGDGVEIASEVQIDVFHGHGLGAAAARGTALHSEARAQRRLAQADRDLAADPRQPVAQPDRRRGLALTGRGRADRRDQNQLAARPVAERGDEIARQFRLGPAIGFQRVLGNTQLAGDFRHRPECRRTGDLDITGHACPPAMIASSETCLARPRGQ